MIWVVIALVIGAFALGWFISYVIGASARKVPFKSVDAPDGGLWVDPHPDGQSETVRRVIELERARHLDTGR